MLSSGFGSFVLALVLVAEGGTVFGRRVVEVDPLTPAQETERRAAFQSMLDSNGWVQHDDQVRPGQADGRFTEEAPRQLSWSTPPHRATIFLNFWGAEVLTQGTNSALDESSCIPSAMEWPGFVGTEQQALALIEVFERNMEPYGVRIAYDRRPPPELPYAMVMMGGTPDLLGLGGQVLGVSCSSDCGDFWWRDTTFAFTGNINPNNASALGTTALHEAAHAFGLAHIDDETKIMNPFVGGGNVTWEEICTPFSTATGGTNCGSTHAEFCDGSGQNSDAELLAFFGPNSPDVEPPVVEILAPADGVSFKAGDSIDIEVDVSDDHEGFGWKLVIPELDQEVPAFRFEHEWTISLPDGTYTVRVEAIDHDRNVGTDEVTIVVGSGQAELPSEDDDEGGDTAGGDDSSGSGGESEGGDAPGAEESAEGCACTTSPSGVPTGRFMAALLLLVPLARRRR